MKQSNSEEENLMVLKCPGSGKHQANSEHADACHEKDDDEPPLLLSVVDDSDIQGDILHEVELQACNPDFVVSYCKSSPSVKVGLKFKRPLPRGSSEQTKHPALKKQLLIGNINLVWQSVYISGVEPEPAAVQNSSAYPDEFNVLSILWSAQIVSTCIVHSSRDGDFMIHLGFSNHEMKWSLQPVWSKHWITVTVGKTIVVDGQIYLGDGQTPLVAALHYFNTADIKFDDIGKFLIHTMVARYEHGAEIPASAVSASEDTNPAAAPYDMVGDIIWLVPAGDIDPCHLPYVHVCGTVTESQKDDSMFCLEPMQYTSVLKSLIKNNPPGSVSVFPVHCTILDSPRYKSGKPIPQSSSIVSAEGWIVAVHQKDSSSKHADRFDVKVEHVCYLGRANVPTTSSVPQTLEVVCGKAWVSASRLQCHTHGSMSESGVNEHIRRVDASMSYVMGPIMSWAASKGGWYRMVDSAKAGPARGAHGRVDAVDSGGVKDGGGLNPRGNKQTHDATGNMGVKGTRLRTEWRRMSSGDWTVNYSHEELAQWRE
ncbi:hypothetical protein BDN67DRAFT_980161 [Paxillus ammoniavirescens]|nr:hypothetical protein BDN67DRAFT_980161 [Paxillus ammoniavirescens]